MAAGLGKLHLMERSDTSTPSSAVAAGLQAPYSTIGFLSRDKRPRNTPTSRLAANACTYIANCRSCSGGANSSCGDTCLLLSSLTTHIAKLPARSCDNFAGKVCNLTASASEVPDDVAMNLMQIEPRQVRNSHQSSACVKPFRYERCAIASATAPSWLRGSAALAMHAAIPTQGRSHTSRTRPPPLPRRPQAAARLACRGRLSPCCCAAAAGRCGGLRAGARRGRGHGPSAGLLRACRARTAAGRCGGPRRPACAETRQSSAPAPLMTRHACVTVQYTPPGECDTHTRHFYGCGISRLQISVAARSCSSKTTHRYCSCEDKQPPIGSAHPCCDRGCA